MLYINRKFRHLSLKKNRICVSADEEISICVSDVLGGYNGTIFAYGQTSSGKTHTMEVSVLVCLSDLVFV